MAAQPQVATFDDVLLHVAMEGLNQVEVALAATRSQRPTQERQQRMSCLEANRDRMLVALSRLRALRQPKAARP